MAEELKPCPFCGSTRVYLDTEPYYRPQVFCWGCNATCGTLIRTEEDAIAAWNKRAE